MFESFDKEVDEKQIQTDKTQMDQIIKEMRISWKRNEVLRKRIEIYNTYINAYIQLKANKGKADRSTSNPKTKQEFVIQNKSHFEQLLNIIHKCPHYLVCLIQMKQRIVINNSNDNDTEHKEVKSFEDALFRLFPSDHSDSRNARLLLQVFEYALLNEVDCASGISHFEFNNDITTKKLNITFLMLTNFFWAHQGDGILKNILTKPIREMIRQNELNLTFQYIYDHFCKPIFESVNKMPYKVRYLSRRLTEMIRVKFPNLNQSEMIGLIGRFVFDYFFKPIILDPKQPLTSTMKRNFELVSMVMTSVFSNKESVSIKNEDDDDDDDDIKEFESENFRDVFEKSELKEYVLDLIDVRELTDALEFDQFNEHTLEQNETLRLSLKQVIDIYFLLKLSKVQWADFENNERIEAILSQIKPMPTGIGNLETTTTTDEMPMEWNLNNNKSFEIDTNKRIEIYLDSISDFPVTEMFSNFYNASI